MFYSKHIYTLIVLFFLVIILLFLLYKLRNLEKFTNENDDIVPDEGNGFSAVHQKETQRKNDFQNKVGGANDWGGRPENPEGDPKSVIAQEQLLNCQKKIDEVNNAFQVYLTNKGKRDRLAVTLRNNEQLKTASDFKEVVDMFKDQTKSSIEKLNGTQIETNTETESLNSCLQDVKPLDESIKNMKDCCDYQKKYADSLNQLIQDCQDSPMNILQKISDAEKTLITIQSQLNDIQNTNNSLTNTLNQCISKKNDVQKTLDNCKKY